MTGHGHQSARRSGLTLVGALLCAGLATAAGPAAGPAAGAPATADQPRPWWYDAMNLAEAHRDVTGDGVTVAVFDGRLDRSAPGLSGADISVETDCHGRQQKALDPARDDHGTTVVSLIAGQGSASGDGVVGAAPDATVLFYPQDTEESRPGEQPFLECTGWHTADQVDAAVRAGADILSFSTGETAEPAPMSEAIDRALDRGVVVVAAAGNQQTMLSPATHPGVVSVNAVDREARPWPGNGRIPRDDTARGFPVISAPGVSVPVLRHLGDEGWTPRHATTGTSLAAPIVAGALALVKQKYPRATGNQLVQHLVHLTGGTRTYRWDPGYGFGIVSVEEMLLQDPAGWPDTNPLLHGPRRAVSDFPMDAYRAGTAGAADSTTAEGAATASEAADSTPAGDRSAAVPWLPVTGAVLALAALLGGAILLRRRPGDSDKTSVERV